jgi:hypothetical protein
MSKIPQGEWSAIAARYAQGESISRIAQSYGCTPPAIHYILKRNKQRAALGREQAPAERRPSQSAVPRARGTPPSGEDMTSLGSSRNARIRGDLQISPVRPAQLEQTRSHLPPRQSASPPNPAQGPHHSVGLDRDLHGRAEAAIQAFRLSFDAALAEGSPLVRQQLRQAAADLMRVAARTTIVLDQLNARAER